VNVASKQEDMPRSPWESKRVAVWYAMAWPRGARATPEEKTETTRRLRLVCVCVSQAERDWNGRLAWTLVCQSASVTRCGRTQRRCWSQMAGCGLGSEGVRRPLAMMAHPPTAAVRTASWATATRWEVGPRADALQCGYPGDDSRNPLLCVRVQTTVDGEKKAQLFCSPMSLAGRSCHMVRARAGAMTGLDWGL
jgi:hypothetical protein